MDKIRDNSLFILTLLLSLSLWLVGCGNSSPEITEGEDTSDGSESTGELIVYSGRNEELVGPLIEIFEEQTDTKVLVNYGETAAMAATILEEGSNSPADVYFGQDAGALGALTKEGRLQKLPEDIISSVEPRFRAPGGEWVGTSGRARVVVYNTDALSESDLPASIMDYTDPKWKGKIGWAPTNGSFQAFITAMRVAEGEEKTRAWLEGIQANEPKVYPKNTPIVEAVATGEIEVGFVNHYYLLRKIDEQGDVAAANYYFTTDDVGGLMNVSGAGIVNTSKHQDAAEAFIRFLLSPAAQEYFRDETNEYPLSGYQAKESLPPLSELGTPEIDLNDLDDLDGTLQLLQDVGVL